MRGHLISLTGGLSELSWLGIFIPAPQRENVLASTVGYAHLSHCWPVPLDIRGIQGLCFIKNHIQKPCFTVHNKLSQMHPNWVRTVCLLLHIPLPFLLSPGIDGMLCRGTEALEMHNHTAFSAAKRGLYTVCVALCQRVC